MSKQILYYILFVIIIFVQNSCKNKIINVSSETNLKTYFCDAETVSKDGKNFCGQQDTTQKFTAGRFQSDDYAHSGKYSILLDNKNKYGFDTKIENIKPDAEYKITVWRYKPNKNDKEGVVAAAIPGYVFFQFADTPVEIDTITGWELLELYIIIPPHIEEAQLKIYVSASDGGVVYFDDLKIEELKPKEYPVYNDEKTFSIYIDSVDMQKLYNIRHKAFEKGILETTDDSWVKAFIFYGDETFKSEVRFKGDWLDHLQGQKWSFRVEIKKKNAWQGIRVFSIQNPNTRFFLHEWVSHKLMEHENVLTTRYGFLPVVLNNKSLGIYAYEEHFVKQLVESKNKREGVIIKLTEHAFWATVKINIRSKNDKWHDLPVYETSFIDPFGNNKILKDENLSNQFLIAQNLLYAHKYSLRKPSEIFDIDKLAKFFAIVDITKSYHSTRWHNFRFYYNPIISKLEVIGYDGYGTSNDFSWFERSIMGNFNPKIVQNCKPEDRINYNLFTDTLFVEKYIYYLEKFTAENYLSNFFNEINDELVSYESMLQKEFERYSYDNTFLFSNAKAIRKELPEYKKAVKNGLYNDLSYKNMPKRKYKDDYDKDLAKNYVHVYKEANSNFNVINYYPLPITILGVGESEDSYTVRILKNNELDSYNSDSNTTSINSDLEANFLFFSVKNQKDVISVPIIQWESPKFTTPLQELIDANIFPENNFYTIENKNVIFKTGKHIISENIIIPKGYKLIINAGTELDLQYNSNFISYSPVYIKGTKNKPVIIKSSDGTAMGFTVLQANEKSVLENVIFDGLNTIDYKGWLLTGAVNFYESEVEIKNSIFKNNKCEDALNIICSDFIVSNCTFINIFSDAFDSDFCTGVLKNSNFTDIGNDAIDFSGSKIDIINCKINNANDKGISGGEGK